MQSFIGLIGAGYWGKNLIREFSNLGVLHSICDLDQNLLDSYSYPNLHKTTNWQELLDNSDITAIVIALPAELHHRFGKQALQHNKDLFIEKPLALSVDHCQELIQFAKEKDKILMVGHLLQYHPSIEKIYQLIDQDYIGQIRYIISNRLNLGKIRKEENVLWSFAPHDISVILHLMKDRLPTSVTCHGQSFLSPNIHDITNTILRFGDDSYVQINVNWLNPFKEQKMTIVGTKGMITFDDTSKEKIHYYSDYMEWNKGIPIAKKSQEISTVISSENDQTPLERECQHFILSCQTRTQPKTNGEEGMRVLEVLNMAQNSLINNGKEIVQERPEKHFVHPTAIIDSGAEIGPNSKIWHFSHLMKCQIGEDANIGQNVFIANNVKLGDHCRVQNNVSIYDGVIAGNYVFFGPSCVLTNDRNPRAKYSKHGVYSKTIIEDGVSIGANATIVCGIKLGKNCLIGAGAVVTKDVMANTVVVGNPARPIRKIDEEGNITELE